ncbi:MAG: rhamnogalacturonan acetylesterase [Verrucomicrobiales bacterium]
MIRPLFQALLALVSSALLHAAEPGSLALSGDSTMASGSGWGDAFAKSLKPGIKFHNMARGGRSSKSYRDEGWWTKTLAQQPTWIFLQFGHNDQPGKGPKRETHPQSTYRENLARYVREARAAGATPILVTSLARRYFNAEGRIVSAPANRNYPDPGASHSLAAYAAATRAVARELDVPLIDLHALSVAALEKMGPEKAAAYDPPPNAEGIPDKTHLTPRGARETAALISAEIRRAYPEIARQILHTPEASQLGD